jgi:hypothetical protein
MQDKEDWKENEVVQEIVIDRFHQYLSIPYMMTVLGSQFLGNGDIVKAPYEPYAEFVKKENPELLGFNVLDKTGLIIRTYPDSGENGKAKGRITQNLGQLHESLNKREAYYFSPPFKLFQGQQGFVFYIPVMKSKKLEGWYAVVISSEGFLRKFFLEDYTKMFDLQIIDKETGIDYFSTSLGPGDAKVLSKETEFYNRKLIFKSWRKDGQFLYNYPWYFSVIMSLLMALAVAFIQRLWAQRKKARGQLDNISILLRVTSKEALNNLIEIHSELNDLNLPEDEKVNRLARDINYLSNLIEQIDLLQTMAHSREGLTNVQDNFHDLITRQLDRFADVINKKSVNVTYNAKDLRSLIISANMWLFENSVLSNVFSHLLIHTEPGSTLTISSRGNIISFTAKRLVSQNTKTVTRRLEVARKVLQLHGGDLKEEATMEELIVTLILPK